MAVALVSAPAPGGGGSIPGRTWNHTFGSGSDRLAVLDAYYGDSRNNVSAATVNGSPCTFLDRVRGANGTTDPWGVDVWYFVNPPSGIQSLDMTAVSCEMWTGCREFSGVDQTGPIRAGSVQKVNVASGVASLVNVPCQVGDFVVDCVGMDSGVPSANQSQTAAFPAQNPSDGQASGYKTAAATSVAMGYAASGHAGLLGFALVPSGGGGGTPSPLLKRILVEGLFTGLMAA